MNGFVEFLTSIMPELMRFAQNLYEASAGDSRVAIKNIKDRRNTIAKDRLKRDQEIAAKHAPANRSKNEAKK